MSALEVLATGPLALVQDLGRVGLGGIGVGRSGAADRGALRLANRLLGNAEGLAGVEVLLGGLRVRALVPVTVCLTGAVGPAEVDGHPVPGWAPVPLVAGQVLALRLAPHGLRTYLCVRGGVAVAPVLGARATDTLAGLGPPPLVKGTVLPVGRPAALVAGVDVAPASGVDVAPASGPEAGTVVLGVLPGPRRDWFEDTLTREEWTVTTRSDRVGVRLGGQPLRRRPEREGTEVPTEGMVRGCVQVPPSGQPVLLLDDHPVTGGYPVVGVVPSRDVDRAAQLRPGQGVRLRWDRE